MLEIFGSFPLWAIILIGIIIVVIAWKIIKSQKKLSKQEEFSMQI